MNSNIFTVAPVCLFTGVDHPGHYHATLLAMGANRNAHSSSGPAKNAVAALDVFEQVKTVHESISQFMSDFKPMIGDKGVNKLRLMKDVLVAVCDVGCKRTAKICPVPYLMRAHAKYQAEIRKRKLQDPYRPLRDENVYDMRKFVRVNTGKEKQRPAKKRKLDFEQVFSNHRERRSSRTNLSMRKNLKDNQKVLADDFTGVPPDGAVRWTKLTLFLYMQELENLQVKMRPFILKVVDKKRSEFTSEKAVYKSYKKWKESGKVTYVGRPVALPVDEGAAIAKATMDRRSHNSNAFQLEHMKHAIESRKRLLAEADGLDPESIDVSITSTNAKITTIAAAMVGDLSLSKKDLQIKTESRFRSEHSVMCGYSYAMTALMSHYFDGPNPPWMNGAKFAVENLAPSTRETLAMVKKALKAENVYPANPNLVLSSDDTTLFTFEGKSTGKGGEEEWEWKLLDKSEGNASVCSDFEVGSDAENGGGLRVRITFTFTLSGLSAPPYIAISGLTDDELSPELCPDGILAEKVMNLCKGGDDIFNSGFGWLVFLRADKKKPSNGEAPTLSIGNKKFMDYNDNVLLPFIAAIRKKLGLLEGQEIPEWMTAISWFDGDIPQLQTMLFESRAALDLAEKIIRNKHAAAATGTQQPCDLSPVFRLLKKLELTTTADDDRAVGLSQTIDKLFAVTLRKLGLNLDGNPKKKRALMDFLKRLPMMLDEVLTKNNISKSFIDAGMADEEAKVFPVFDKLIGTCKRWVSDKKDLGISRTIKRHCKSIFDSLAQIWLGSGELTYPQMLNAGLPKGKQAS